MNIPANLKYTKSDEWFNPETGAMGLSDYAQSQLSDIVFVEILVDEGDTLEAGKPIASVESVKASAEIYASGGGTVTAVNKGLSDKPETLNTDPRPTSDVSVTGCLSTRPMRSTMERPRPRPRAAFAP